MPEKTYHVLFLSQRNSARSIMAEAILNSIGRGHFIAYSAGVKPASDVDPVAIELLEHAKLSTTGLTPRHAREFTRESAPALDFVFTLSDTAAGEAPPEWPGQPITAHWRSEDPTKISDATERRLALIRVRSELERRLRVFINLPFAALDRMSAQRQVDEIGNESSPASTDVDQDSEPPHQQQSQGNARPSSTRPSPE